MAIFDDLKNINVWGRDFGKAEIKASELKAMGVNANATHDHAAAILKSDIISTATYSKTPIVNGQYVKQGSHVDLIGSYLPDHREGDNNLIAKSSIFIDTKAALHESGDLVIPIEEGVIKKSDVQGTLIQLCNGEDPGRLDKKEITFFKSVGYALEDLAIAIYLHQKHNYKDV